MLPMSSLIATKGNIGKIKAVARVDNEVAAEGEFIFALVSPDLKRGVDDSAVEKSREE